MTYVKWASAITLEQTNMSATSLHLILDNSMQPVTKLSLFGVRLGVVALAVYWAALFAGTHVPSGATVAPFLSDKIKHFGGYFGLTILMCYVGHSSDMKARYTRVALIALAYGIFDELTQMLVPGRSAEVLDFVADACGIACAIAVYALLRHYFRKPASTEST